MRVRSAVRCALPKEMGARGPFQIHPVPVVTRTGLQAWPVSAVEIF